MPVRLAVTISRRRVFKQMTRLTKQMEKLDAMLSDVKFTNYKGADSADCRISGEIYPGCGGDGNTDEEISEVLYHS